MAFPSNEFGNQEPGSEAEIKKFATEKYHVTFKMFEKIRVNGDDAHPVFKYLRNELRGISGTTSVKWNFTKFLVDRNGKPFKRYSNLTPSKNMEQDILSLLNSSSNQSSN